jgi:hypothetical protein
MMQTIDGHCPKCGSTDLRMIQKEIVSYKISKWFMDDPPDTVVIDGQEKESDLQYFECAECDAQFQQEKIVFY